MEFIDLEKGQYLRIGNHIRIKFHKKSKESEVRIGIDAPIELRIVRGEAPQNYPYYLKEKEHNG